MKKEKELQFDKYNFALTEFSTKRKNSKICISAYYTNNKEYEDPCFTISIPCKGLLKDRTTILLIKTALEEKNILDGFIYLMHIKFGSVFIPTSEGEELIESLPDSIILDDSAVKQILHQFDSTDKSLVALANRIRYRKTEILEQIDEKKNRDAQLKKDAEKIKKEFGL